MKTKVKAKNRAGRNVYSLAPKVDVTSYHPTTHAGATIRAIRKLGTATSREVINEVVKQKKMDTTMNVPDAVRFQLFDLSSRRGVLRKKPAQSVSIKRRAAA